jgi:heptosyltransferase-2
MAVNKILIRVPNWIGDVMMSLPAVRAVRSNFPRAEIMVLARPWVADLYRLIGEVDEIIPCENRRGAARVPAFLSMARQLRRRDIDWAILFQNAFEAAFLSAAAGIPVRIGYNAQRRGVFLTKAVRSGDHGSQRHQVHDYLRLLAAADLEIGPPEFRVRMPEDIVGDSDGLLPGGSAGGAPCIGFNLGAFFGSAKRWPADRFLGLVRRVKEELDVRILMFGLQDITAAEKARFSVMEERGVVKGYAMLPLLHLAGLISRCALFVTNDSGPMHLAAALGVPVVALFGPTDASATGPLGDGHVIIRKDADCAPCGMRECPVDHRCMMEISQQEVFRIIHRKFSTAS